MPGATSLLMVLTGSGRHSGLADVSGAGFLLVNNSTKLLNKTAFLGRLSAEQPAADSSAEGYEWLGQMSTELLSGLCDNPRMGWSVSAKTPSTTSSLVSASGTNQTGARGVVMRWNLTRHRLQV